MKYTKEGFTSVLEELGIEYKIEDLSGYDLYLFRIMQEEKNCVGGICIFPKEDFCVLYVPKMCEYEELNQNVLLAVNKLNAELQYGRLYIDEKSMQLSYRAGNKMEEIEKEDIESYFSELLYVMNRVNCDEIR